MAAYFILHHTFPAYEAEAAEVPAGKASGAAYSVRVCGTGESQSACEPARLIKLKPDYYKGDRFDARIGIRYLVSLWTIGGAATHHYAPVCLNSLLYKTEQRSGRNKPPAGQKRRRQWVAKARGSTTTVNHARIFVGRKTGVCSSITISTMRRNRPGIAMRLLSYPLWAGVASPAPSPRSGVKNLSVFERAGGIAMSVQETEGQWDYPFGWAPIQLLAVERHAPLWIQRGSEPRFDRVSFDCATKL